MSSIQSMIDELIPNGSPGFLPKVTPCPHCGKSMSQTDHATHRPACERESGKRPPQPADFMHDAGGGYNTSGTFPQT